MDQVQLFSFEARQIRILGDAANPRWVAVDVGEAIGLSARATKMRVSKMPESWKGLETITTPGGKQKMIVLLEPGLYSLIFRSNRLEAIKFQKWALEEVLPSIRKKGFYELPNEAKRRMRVVTALLKLKHEYWKDLSSVNLCNDLIDFTNGTADFPQLSVDDCEELLEILRIATISRNQSAYYDVKVALERVLSPW
ncbi:MAG TPA: hypothetical protein DEV81_13280, partial [Cyanobacteria bacterium UBA11049]|nr:hypothetical protein [Cyanobacteria bacterium UBA11049]